MRVTAHDIATSRTRMAPVLARGIVLDFPPVRQGDDIVSGFHHGPVFGGDSGKQGVLPGASRSPARRERKQRFERLQVRAFLYQNPATPCTAQDVAEVFGLRESAVRSCRPVTAKKCGRGLLAPFSHWRTALERAGLLPTWKSELLDDEGRVARPRRARARDKVHRLSPIGGHRRS